MTSTKAPPKRNPAVLKQPLAALITALMAWQGWLAIDPQPTPLIWAVLAADEAFISAWALLLASATVGLFCTVRFIVGTALPAVPRGRASSVIGIAATVALVGGAVTGMLAEGTAIAMLLAVASFWFAATGAADPLR